MQANDLHVRFVARQTKRWPWSKPGQVKAVNGVSLTLDPGRTLGVVGESGCGKSTLIRAIAGLTPLDRGQVLLDGEPVDYANRASLQRLRARVQMVFQDPVSSLNPRMTIRDIVSEPLVYFRPKLDGTARRRVAMDMLERVGISANLANRFPHEFSGGQCQRIGIARALVAQPRVLLCDEPVSALDVSIQAQVINLLKELQREMGVALVFVAHDLGVVRHISDTVLVMYMGGMMERAPAGDLVADPRHPYSKALLSAVPVPDPDARLSPQVLKGDLPSPLDLPQGCLFEARCPVALPACRAARPPLIDSGDRAVACIRAEPEPV
nr:oligopeptide/dipeptide ABC transporter ATP-binding protein [Cognatishimia sp. F0-27]